METIVQFAGTTFKITEFKLRPQKPRPKNYPEKEKEANGVKEENEENEEKNETSAVDKVTIMTLTFFTLTTFIKGRGERTRGQGSAQSGSLPGDTSRPDNHLQVSRQTGEGKQFRGKVQNRLCKHEPEKQFQKGQRTDKAARDEERRRKVD